MRRLKYLLEKEFKRIFRDRFMPKVIFALPVIQLLILPFAADFEIKNINVCVIDRDCSALSSRLARKAGASKYFDASCADSYEGALGQIERGNFDLILEIPRGFEKDAVTKNSAELLVSLNAVNGIKGGLGGAYMGAVIEDFARELADEGSARANPRRLEVLVENRYNPHLNSRLFIVPGVFVFLLSLIGGLLASLNIVSEKEAGTMEQMNVAPISKLEFIASKLVPVWIIGMIILHIGMLISFLVYGLLPHNLEGFLIIYAFAAVYLSAFTSFGLIVSTMADNAQQAILTFLFFIMIFLLMSGIFTPISSMPEWAQNLTLLNPPRYFVEVMRAVYLRGAAFEDLLGNFCVLCVFAVVFGVYAVARFRRSVG